MKKLTFVAALLILVGGQIACSKTDKYEISVTKDHSAYMISRQGVLIREQQFDVIFVFGQADNESVAKELTEYLNKQEAPKTYRYRRFYPGDKINGMK